MVLDEREHRGAVGREIRNHVGRGNKDLSVQDVVISIVAFVDNPSAVHHQTRGVALAVGAGVGFVGWHTVIGNEFIGIGFRGVKNDDAPTGAFHGRH